MNRKIRLSTRALRKLDNLLVYLEKEWTLKVKHSFIVKLDKSFQQIQKHPDSFPESDKVKGLRKCVITRQTTVFYKYTDTHIDIVTIFDTRQNPKRLKNDPDRSNRK